MALLVQLSGACSDSPTPPDQGRNESAAAKAANPRVPSADEKLVVAFGDSLYAGYDLDQDEGFAPALERELVQNGIAARVVNAGVSGETTAGGLQRLAFTLDGLPRKPDLVIVGLGGNDMLRGLDPAATRANLDGILAELERRGIDAMLTGMLASPNMGPAYEEAFNTIYPDLAKQYDVPLYPFILEGVVGRSGLMLPDGLHPNARGVNIMADRVAPLVGSVLAGEERE